MPVIYARIPEELNREIEELMQEEKIEKDIALGKLLTTAIAEWKKEKALKMLAEGRISYLRAAEKAGMNPWDFAEVVKEKKIVWIRDVAILKDLNAHF
jgi:Uncharacterised protein family (UPF0175).